MTLIELAIVVGIGAILLVLAAIAVAGARASANETSAIGSLRPIYVALAPCAATGGRGGSAPSLPVRGRPARGGRRPYLEPDLATDVRVFKAGYWITSRVGYLTVPIQVFDCNGELPLSSYYATAARRSTTPCRSKSAEKQRNWRWQDVTVAVSTRKHKLQIR